MPSRKLEVVKTPVKPARAAPASNALRYLKPPTLDSSDEDGGWCSGDNQQGETSSSEDE